MLGKRQIQGQKKKTNKRKRHILVGPLGPLLHAIVQIRPHNKIVILREAFSSWRTLFGSFCFGCFHSQTHSPTADIQTAICGGKAGLQKVSGPQLFLDVEKIRFNKRSDSGSQRVCGLWFPAKTAGSSERFHRSAQSLATASQGFGRPQQKKGRFRVFFAASLASIRLMSGKSAIGLKLSGPDS